MTLKIMVKERMAEVRAFAEKEGILPKLEDRLEYLANYGQGPTRCIVSGDWAPHSFALTMQRPDDAGGWGDWWVGGLIYHEHDRDWGVHT